MSTTEEKAKALYEDFPKAMEKSISKGGRSLTYIPASEVVNRLNRVFGIDGWISETVQAWRDGDTIVAHVRLTAFFDTPQEGATFSGRREISHDGFGGVAIKMKSGTKDPQDLGDEYKGAASDALKKAATLFGVALYLARDDAALDAEAVADAPAYVPTEKDAAWDTFVGLSRTLNDDGKKALKAFWQKRLKETERAADVKPSKDNVDLDDIGALADEALRLTFDGQYVDEANAA